MKPADRISEVLRLCAAKAQNFTLKILIIHGAPTMKMQGYHIPGEPWVEFDYEAMIEFPERAFNDACASCGCDMASRPVKQAGFAYHWLMVVRDTTKLSNTPRTLHAEAVERVRLNKSMNASADAHRALETLGL